MSVCGDIGIYFFFFCNRYHLKNVRVQEWLTLKIEVEV